MKIFLLCVFFLIDTLKSFFHLENCNLILKFGNSKCFVMTVLNDIIGFSNQLESLKNRVNLIYPFKLGKKHNLFDSFNFVRFTM